MSQKSEPLLSRQLSEAERELVAAAREKAHILYAGDTFCTFEIFISTVAAFLTLAGVIDQEFGNLTQSPAFFAVIDD